MIDEAFCNAETISRACENLDKLVANIAVAVSNIFSEAREVFSAKQIILFEKL